MEVAFDTTLDLDSEGEVDSDSLDDVDGKIPDDINESFSLPTACTSRYRAKGLYDEGNSLRFDPYEDTDKPDNSFFGGLSRYSTLTNDTFSSITETATAKIRKSLTGISDTLISKASETFGERLSTFKPIEQDPIERVSVREYIVNQEVSQDLTTTIIRTTRVEEKVITREFKIKRWEYLWAKFVGDQMKVDLGDRSRQIVSHVEKQEELQRTQSCSPTKGRPSIHSTVEKKKRRVSIFNRSQSTPGDATTKGGVRKKLFKGESDEDVNSVGDGNLLKLELCGGESKFDRRGGSDSELDETIVVEHDHEDGFSTPGELSSSPSGRVIFA